MAWNGSGVFSRVRGAASWVADRVGGIKILATLHDANDQDLANGINACLTRDNQAKPTANFQPNVDGSYSLGALGLRWFRAYLSSGVAWIVNSVEVLLQAPTTTRVARTLTLPDATGQIGLMSFNFIYGLVPAVALADPLNDITFNTGGCVSQNNEAIVLSSSLVKQIDAVWAAGTNAGGRFPAAAVGTNTWYHLFVIKNTSTGAVDAGFDTSVVAANRPSGWDQYRRVGSVRTNGSSQITQFLAFEKRGGDIEYLWEDTSLDLTGFNQTVDTWTTRTMTGIPPVTCTGKHTITVGTGNTNSGLLLARPISHSENSAPSALAGALLRFNNATLTGSKFEMPYPTGSQTFQTNSSGASTNGSATNIGTEGFTDHRF